MFKVGDRVISKGTLPGYEGVGTIVEILSDERLMVDYDSNHNQYGICSHPKDTKRFPDSRIVITTDGVTTTARKFDDKKVVKSAEAKCAPGDEFCFETGAGLAYSRLMGGSYSPVDPTQKPEPTKEDKPEPVKLYCVKSYKPGKWLTRGKIYELSAKSTVVADDGRVDTYDDRKMAVGEMPFSQYFAKLVSRPAKVGEYIVLQKEPDPIYPTPYHAGDLIKITHVGFLPSIKSSDGENYVGFFRHEYLVLDGYDGRYEEAEKPTKEMTVAEIEKALGYSVKVVKGDGE